MCQAKYITVVMVACQEVWLRQLLFELVGEEACPLTLMVDNQSAMAHVKKPVFHDRSKHIDIKFHFLRDCIDGGQIVIEFVEIGKQLADILTKSLERLWFMELRKMIGMDEVKA